MHLHQVCKHRERKLQPVAVDYTPVVFLLLEALHIATTADVRPTPSNPNPPPIACSWDAVWKAIRNTPTLKARKEKLDKSLRAQLRLRAFLTSTMCTEGLVRSSARWNRDKPPFQVFELTHLAPTPHRPRTHLAPTSHPPRTHLAGLRALPGRQ